MLFLQINSLLEYQGRFVPIELLQFKAGSHMVDIGETPLTVKKAILMPIYPATLQHPPTIPDNFLYVIGNHVKVSRHFFSFVLFLFLVKNQI
jgi:hypothetical protein